jgi:hypothetical protein
VVEEDEDVEPRSLWIWDRAFEKMVESMSWVLALDAPEELSPNGDGGAEVELVGLDEPVVEPVCCCDPLGNRSEKFPD